MSPSTHVLTQVNIRDSKTITISLSVQRKIFLLVFLSLALIFDLIVHRANSNDERFRRYPTQNNYALGTGNYSRFYQ